MTEEHEEEYEMDGFAMYAEDPMWHLENMPYRDPKRQKLHEHIVKEQRLGDTSAKIVCARTGGLGCKITTAAYNYCDNTLQLKALTDPSFHCTLDLAGINDMYYMTRKAEEEEAQEAASAPEQEKPCSEPAAPEQNSPEHSVNSNTTH